MKIIDKILNKKHYLKSKRIDTTDLEMKMKWL